METLHIHTAHRMPPRAARSTSRSRRIHGSMEHAFTGLARSIQRAPTPKPETADIQTVLENKLIQLQRLQTLVTKTLVAAQPALPALTFLSSHALAKAKENAETSLHVKSLLDYLGRLTVLDKELASLQSTVATLLDQTRARGDHQRVDASGYWLKRYSPQTVDRFLAALDGVQQAPAIVTHSGSDGIEHLLRYNARLAPSTGASAQAHTSALPTPSARVAAFPANFAQARAAKPAMLARIFKEASPIAHNVHFRRRDIADQSRIEIQAHEPVLTTTLGSKLEAITRAIFLGSDCWLPYNAVWQGYTAHIYESPHASKPSVRKSFYSYKTSSGVFHAVKINGQTSPENMENSADHPEDYVWRTWRSGNAKVREPAFDGSGQHRAAANPLHTQANQLVQFMAGFAPFSGGGQHSPTAPPPDLAHSDTLIHSAQGAPLRA